MFRPGALLKLLVAFTLFLPLPHAFAATYYVSNSGSDSSSPSAGSQSSPFQTLQFAADRVRPGDTVNVLPGSYAGFELKTSGTSSAPIWFHAQSGATVVSASARSTDLLVGIDLNHVSYAIIDGFTINAGQFSGSVGIRSYGGDGAPATGNIYRNNVIDNADYCAIIASWQQNGLAFKNTMTNGHRNGIYFGNSCSDSSIIANRIVNSGKHGIMLNGDGSAGGNGLMLRLTIDSNTIVDTGTNYATTGDGAGICAQGVQNSTISNNLIVHSGTDGIRLDQGPDSLGAADSNIVVNNTVNGSSNGGANIDVRNGSNNVIFNNALYNDTTYGNSRGLSIYFSELNGVVVGNISDYNALSQGYDGYNSGDMTLAGWQSASGQDLHSISMGGGGDTNNNKAPAPDLRNQFWSDWANGNYYPLASGKLIAKGISSFNSDSAPSADLDGCSRTVVNGAVDIGAFVFGGTNCSLSQPGLGGGVDPLPPLSGNSVPASGTSSPAAQDSAAKGCSLQLDATSGFSFGLLALLLIFCSATLVLRTQVPHSKSY